MSADSVRHRLSPDLLAARTNRLLIAVGFSRLRHERRRLSIIVR